MPLSQPIRGIDGSEIKEIFVPAGTAILTNLRACNRIPEVWGEDADEWKPDRWLKPLPETVANARIPGVYSNLYAGHVIIGFLR